MGMEPIKENDPKQLGNWRIMGRLGEGGFGTVFLAERGAQKAAIKVIRDDPETFSGGLERFQLEITALEKLVDPFIAKLVDSDLNGDIPWFATEFVNGPTLEVKIKYEGVLEGSKWFQLSANLFHALNTSHAAGIVHKDIKPSNIILGELGNKLIDFGIAHISGHTRKVNFGDFEGSRPYSSPESSTGNSVPGMDVFSAAVTLAYAGLGRSIWAGDTEVQLMRSINESEPDLEGLSELQKTFLKPLLNKNVSDRPSAEEAYRTSLEILTSLDGKVSEVNLRRWKRLAKSVNTKGHLKPISILVSVLLLVGGIGSYEFLNSRATPEIGPVKVSQTPSYEPSPSLESSPKSEGSPPSTLSPASRLSVSPAPKPTGFNSNDCQELFLSNSKDALEACKTASTKNDDRSTYYLAALYDQRGQKKEAETYYLKAINLYKDDTKSMLGLVQIYLDRKDSKNYNLWVSKCANYIFKTTSGARCKLLYGIDQKNAGQTESGIAYLTDAFEWGNVSAGTVLAKHYETKKDNSKALIWYEKAAGEGDPLARDQLIAFSYYLQRFDIWKKWITKSATEGNITDVGKLAVYLTIADKNYVEGKKWGIIGGNAGDAVSMFAAGYSYYKGDKNLPEAKNWLLKSAKLNNILSARVLGQIFRGEKNFADAIIWYKKASTGDDLSSTYQLAMIYLNDLNNLLEGCNYFRSTLNQAEKLKKSGEFDPSEQQIFVDNSETGIATFCS